MRNTSLTVRLSLLDDSFQVEACFEFVERPVNEMSFLLNDELHILSVTDENDIPVSYSKTDTVTPTFRPPCGKIAVKGDNPFSALHVKYSGTVRFDEEKRRNWHNAVTPDFVSLNWYSAWFPEDVSVPLSHDRVIVENGSKWVVVKGEYDEKNDVWLYGDHGFDAFNIVAYSREKLHVVDSSDIKIYFLDESLLSSAEQCVYTYREIVQFYKGELFGQRDLPKLDVVCAFPIIQSGGAYLRKGLMWCVQTGTDALWQTYIFAHETAHIWCCGADCGSWEDWLNETTAEWAALLFALHKKNTALFDKILQPALEKATSLPPIKTADGSRPEGVHEKGTALFYRVYEKYGGEAVTGLVRCFAELSDKNTESFLAELRKRGLNGAADIISADIDTQ